MAHDSEEWWCEIWRKTDLLFQKWQEFVELWPEHLKVLKIWFLLCKVYNVWPKHVQRSCLSWHWRVMQNLKGNCLVVSKLTWGVWRILTRALESLKNMHFNGLYLSKVYKNWAKKVQRSCLSWHWRVKKNLKKNWLAVWKMTWGMLTNFHQSIWKSQDWDFEEIVLYKVENVWA